MTFEKLILLDFWTYNVIYFLSCFLSLVGRKINVNILEMPKSIRRYLKLKTETNYIINL